MRATVVEVGVDPLLQDSMRRYVARVRIDEVLEGALPVSAIGTVVNLLVHSPSMTFRDPDPVGSTFLISLTTPVTDPYTGPIEVLGIPENR